jgi:hypothetical protein
VIRHLGDAPTGATRVLVRSGGRPLFSARVLQSPTPGMEVLSHNGIWRRPMPIQQTAVADMIKACGPAAQTKGRRVWICDGANMMTAMNYFRDITGEEFDLLKLPTVPSGFKLKTVSQTIADKDVKVTLRGGSSSSIEAAGNKHHGPPTLEIQNAEALTLVPQFVGFPAKTIVEVKFSTRAEFARWAEYGE